ncbi:MAG: tRNA dihydrouridine synthase DusB [Alphaproteobacteria bacterium]|mgnify:CR=1 FL=1|nr:tRNA dihydrouridine synthase DusB [Alphaproteobacteria bacterium]
MFLVGDIQISAPVFLAPMSGVTDAPFRTQASRFGAPAVVTEMVAGAELAKDTEEFVRRAAPHGGAGPFIVQLAGREPLSMRIGAERAEASGADIIDINMGCPSKKVTGGQSGCALMREPRLARELIAATVKAVRAPVTVKMRLGWDDASLNAPELARVAEGEGARMIAVHGRTRNQFYEGRADWARIAPVVAATTLPVIANGNITDNASARAALEQSGAAGIMIGRGAVGRPWLPAAIAGSLFGTPYAEPTSQEKLQSMIDQIAEAARLYGDGLGVRVVRKHIAAFVDAWCEDHGLRPMPEARTALCRLDNPSALADRLFSALYERRLAA